MEEDNGRMANLTADGFSSHQDHHRNSTEEFASEVDDLGSLLKTTGLPPFCSPAPCAGRRTSTTRFFVIVLAFFGFSQVGMIDLITKSILSS